MQRERPFSVAGHHFSFYLKEVEALLASEEYRRAEALLLQLIDASEAQAGEEATSVSPWFYRKLAELYHLRHETAAEIQVLERYAAQDHTGTVDPQPLLRMLRQRNLEAARQAAAGPAAAERQASEGGDPGCGE